MTDIVTDPDLLDHLNQSQSQPQPGVRFAPVDNPVVSDPALLDHLNSEAAPAIPQGKPSSDDLVWTNDGGRDPKTGELVVAGKPFTQNAPSSGLAFKSGFLDGVPIVGPYLRDAAIKAGSYARNQIYGDPQDQTESAVQGDISRAQQAYPKTTLAGNVAGGVATLGPVAGTEYGGLALGARGANVLTRSVAGAATGSALGAADAGVRTGGDLDAMRRSAIVSALLGGTAPAVGSAFGSLADRAGQAVNYFRPNVSAENAMAADILSSGVDINELRSRLAANPRLTLMDVDPVLQTRGMGLAGTMEGQSRPILQNAVNARTAGAGQAVTDAYDAAMGPTPDVHALLTGLQQTARSNADQGFGAALRNAGPVNVNPVIDAIDRQLYPGGVPDPSQMQQLGHGPAQDALLRVRNQLANGGNPAGGAFSPAAGGQVFDANRLHEIQSEIRREAETLGSSADGQDRVTATALRGVRQNLVDQIDRASGGLYRPAQRQYADDMAVQDAFHQGLGIFRNRTGAAGIEDRPEYFQQWLNNASPIERQAATQGARVAVDNTVRATRFAARKGTDLPDVPANFDKLSALLGPEEAGNLQRTMQDERAIADTNNKLFQNSLTQPRQEAQKSVAVRPIALFSTTPLAIPLLAETLGIHGNPYAAGAALFAGGARTAGSAVGRQVDIARNAAMARMLSATGDEGQAVSNAIRERIANNGRPSLSREAAQQLAIALMNSPDRSSPYGALPPRGDFR